MLYVYGEVIMKKFLSLVLSMSIVSIGSISWATGYYCPTESEYRAKEKSFMQRVSNPSITKSEFSRISNENDAYDLSVFKNCLGYLKTTPNPDCSKVTILQDAYFSQLGTNAAGAKAQVYDALKYLGTKCQTEQSVLKMFLRVN